VFHNRLTHSLKVAQVARRLAEALVRGHGVPIDALDPDVVETAALAHDLGHPPFGHAGEKALCDAAEECGLPDGFEGNAQTFRILSRLAISRQAGAVGLDLTRASLAAVTKYPWPRDLDQNSTAKARRKFGAYQDDLDALEFALGASRDQSLEAQVMDLADAITYSVHDLEDFYRAGLIPLERLARNSRYRREFLKRWSADKPGNPSFKYADSNSGWEEISNLLETVLSEVSEPGGQKESELLEAFRSRAITQFLSAVRLVDGRIHLDDEYEHQIRFLQRLIWDYVILSPRLATQQVGQVRIVKNLAQYFDEAIRNRSLDRIPTRFRAMAEALIASKAEPTLKRLAIDIVASLSEAEAVTFHRKIMGHDSGSILDLVR
jgi:dGTPase